MFKKIFFFFLFLNLLSNIFAQESVNYNITAHRAFIRINPELKKLDIIDTIKLEFLENKKNLKLILNPIFDSVSILYKQKPLKHERKNEFIFINGKFDSADELIINYNGYFKQRSEFSCIDVKSAILKEQEILPIGTRSYKYTRFTIQTPIEWDAIALGKKVYDGLNQNSRIHIFENNNLVETIGWICAGKYYSTEDSLSNIKLSIMTSPENADAHTPLYNLIKKSITFYSKSFNPYRFPTLTIVEVDDWLAGNTVLAASYPSVILTKRRTFTTADSLSNIFSILPHEIAHQWWPLTNFIEEESIAFLSEGLCEYSAYLFNETQNKPTNLNKHPLLRSLLLKSEKGKELPLNKKIDLRSLPTHYLKSAYVHHMLRFIIGDSNYKKLLKEYSDKHSVKVSSTKIFFELAESISGKKLDWFNKQWIENTGIPRFRLYGVQTNFKDTIWYTTGRVRILGYSNNFTTPVEISAEHNNEISRQILWLGYDETGKYKNETVFNFTTKNKPDKIVLDPDGYILKWQKLPPKFSDLRDPSEGFMIIGTSFSSERYQQLINLARNDSSEMTKAGWYIKILDDTSTTLVHLQSEHIFIYGNINENKIAEQCFKYFPIKPSLNSVELNGKTYSDSLSFMQIIDSPFSSQGTICWILPFTKNSNPVLLPYDASYLILDKTHIVTQGNWKTENQDLIFEIK